MPRKVDPFTYIDVDSTNISQIGVNPETMKTDEFQTLRVRFVKGETLYEYYQVPIALVKLFITAPSKGSFHAANIAKAAFQYKRIA